MSSPFRDHSRIYSRDNSSNLLRSRDLAMLEFNQVDTMLNTSNCIVQNLEKAFLLHIHREILRYFKRCYSPCRDHGL